MADLVFARYIYSRGELEYGRDPHFCPLFWAISFVYTPANIVKGIVRTGVARDADPNWYKAARSILLTLGHGKSIEVKYRSALWYRAAPIIVPRSFLSPFFPRGTTLCQTWLGISRTEREMYVQIFSMLANRAGGCKERTILLKCLKLILLSTFTVNS